MLQLRRSLPTHYYEMINTCLCVILFFSGLYLLAVDDRYTRELTNERYAKILPRSNGTIIICHSEKYARIKFEHVESSVFFLCIANNYNEGLEVSHEITRMKLCIL